MYKAKSNNLQHAAGQARESATERETKKQSSDKIIKAAIGGQSIGVGHIVTGRVNRIERYGAIISIGDINGFVHISEITSKRIKHPSELFNIGDYIQAVVISLDIKRYRVNLSINQLPDHQPEPIR